MALYGVSTDTPESHAKFRESLDLPFPLLADVGGDVSTAYDSAMEHEGQVYSARKIVLIDKAGKVVYRNDAFKVGDPAEFDEIHQAIDALGE